MLENVKIDKDVPIPKSRKRTDQKPWCDMEAGDSFFVPGFPTSDENSRLRKSLMHLGHKYFGAGGYSVKAREENARKGFRVWRR